MSIPTHESCDLMFDPSLTWGAVSPAHQRVASSLWRFYLCSWSWCKRWAPAPQWVISASRSCSSLICCSVSHLLTELITNQRLFKRVLSQSASSRQSFIHPWFPVSQCVHQSLGQAEQQLKRWHHPSTRWKMQQRRGGGCCLGDITAIARLAGGSGDVTHLQAALLSFEPRLALREGDGRRESCVVLNLQHWLQGSD